MEKTIYIVVGCDTDPDRDNYLDNVPKDTLGWRGMLEGIPLLKDQLKEVRDSDGKSPVVSWCLRADHQIKEIYGSYNYVLNENKVFLEQLESDGDELAWHPHFWRFDENLERWYQDCFDSEWQVKMLESAYKEYIEVLPGRAKSVRMGWDYHNNKTFQALERLGVETDFSGIPGLKIDPPNSGTRSVNFFDWSLSPNRPYYPSTNDYRREASKDESTSTLLEAPNFVSRSYFWGLIAGAVLMKKMKDPMQLLRAFRRPTYWVGVTGKPFYFAPLMAQIERSLRRTDQVIFVTYFHPDELIPNNSGIYSLDNMKTNLYLLTKIARELGASTKYIRAQDIKSVLKVSKEA